MTDQIIWEQGPDKPESKQEAAFWKLNAIAAKQSRYDWVKREGYLGGEFLMVINHRTMAFYTWTVTPEGKVAKQRHDTREQASHAVSAAKIYRELVGEFFPESPRAA